LRRFVVGLCAVVIVGASVACSPPNPSGVVGLGAHEGVISSTSPVTFTYEGTAGEHLNMAIGLPGGGPSSPDRITVTGPGGSAILSTTDHVVTEHEVLPATGTYSIAMRVSNFGPDYFQVVLTHDVDQGEIPLNTNVPGPIWGQTYTFHYNGTVGEQLDAFGLQVVAPDSSPVPTGTGLAIGRATLPVTGAYTLVATGAEGSTNDPVALSHDLDLGPLQLGLNPLPSVAFGRHVLYSYSGTAGETVSTDNDESTLYDPSDTLVHKVGFFARFFTLPTTGQYTLLTINNIDASFHFDHPVDGGVLALGDTPAPALDPDQPVVYHYAGTAGETLTIGTVFDQAGIPPEEDVFGPDGAQINGTRYDLAPTASDRSGIKVTLPTTGTYTIYVTLFAPDPSMIVQASSA
jgi:hypothetical protein